MTDLIAFHNKPELKLFILGSLAQHREADKLIRGNYWAAGKGCAVGCTLEALRQHDGKKDIAHGDHTLYETALGIPQIIARLEDRIFEGLSNNEAQLWPERFTNAIQPGANLTMIWPRFALWLLTEELPQRTKEGSKQRAALADVAGLYQGWIDSGKNPDRPRWLSARKTATDAATDAATYAATDAATYAAYADAATYAAAYATDAATYAAYADAATDAATYAATYAAYADAATDAATYADAATDAATYAATYAAYAAYAAAATDAATYAATYAAYAAYAARQNFYSRAADKLVQLLEQAPC